MNTNHSSELESMAIIGMAFRFPGASTLKQYWENLRDGVESISRFTEKQLLSAGVPHQRLSDSNYVPARGILENIEFFDAALFGFTPREAEITDPQHRVLLECAWEALEHAGYDPERYSGDIGIYAGMVGSTYLFNNLLPNQAVWASVGDFRMEVANDKDHLNTRISYKLNLKGPSVNVNTACSTSLVAVHTACQSLLHYECDMALAGASYIRVPQVSGYFYTEGGTESPDGHCRTFDEQAGGAVGGNGSGLVVLKRLQEALADGDHIYAVIKGSCVNNDGADRVGYTAPSIDGQARAIAGALALADVDPSTIDYVETHGTATALGDSIEVSALKQVFQQGGPRRSPCLLGAVKTNVGHLGSAAGLAGLIKAILALHHKTIPPTLHFQKPNPNLNLKDSPFSVNTKPLAWEQHRHPRRAGVSSFGIGGTNAHVILEEAPERRALPTSRKWQLLVLSAKTESALEKHTANLAEHLRQESELSLADVSFTLRMGRKILGNRRAVIADSLESAANQLLTAAAISSSKSFCEMDDRPVVFLFPGENDSKGNAGRDLYSAEPVFRSVIDSGTELLASYLRMDVRDILYPQEKDRTAAGEKLRLPSVAQPCALLVQYALAKLWMHWGITPGIMIGDGIGEYTAACVAGVFSFEDALRVAAVRGELVQSVRPGAAMAVQLAQETLRPLLTEGVCIAAVYGPSQCLVAGPQEEVRQLWAHLINSGVKCQDAEASHAPHSSMMDPIIGPFMERLKRFKLHEPASPFISSISGAAIREGEASRPDYWARQLRSTMQLAAGLRGLQQIPGRVLLEMGTGNSMWTVAAPVVRSLPASSGSINNDEQFILQSLAALWLGGVKIDWSHFRDDEQRLRAPLPTYPFERQKYWLDVPSRSELMESLKLLVASISAPDTEQRAEKAEPAPSQPVVRPLPLYSRPPMMPDYVAPRNSVERAIAAIWSDVLGIAEIGMNDRFFELGGDSLLANQILVRFASELQVQVPVKIFFERPTIAELSEFIAAMQIEAADDQALAATLEDIKNLSEEELQRLLAEPETTIN